MKHLRYTALDTTSARHTASVLIIAERSFTAERLGPSWQFTIADDGRDMRVLGGRESWEEVRSFEDALADAERALGIAVEEVMESLEKLEAGMTPPYLAMPTINAMLLPWNEYQHKKTVAMAGELFAALAAEHTGERKGK